MFLPLQYLPQIEQGFPVNKWGLDWSSAMSGWRVAASYLGRPWHPHFDGRPPDDLQRYGQVTLRTESDSWQRSGLPGLAHDLWTRACEKLTDLGIGRGEPPGTAVYSRPAGPALDWRDSDNIINYVLVKLQAHTKNFSMRRGLIRRLYVLYVWFWKLCYQNDVIYIYICNNIVSNYIFLRTVYWPPRPCFVTQTCFSTSSCLNSLTKRLTVLTSTHLSPCTACIWRWI